MDAAAVIATLSPLVSAASFEVGRCVDMPTVYVPADRLVETRPLGLDRLDRRPASEKPETSSGATRHNVAASKKCELIATSAYHLPHILLWSRQTRACFGDPVYTFIDIEQRTRRSVAFRRLSSTSCALMESACAPRERISAYPGCVICLEPWARTTRTFDLANWTSRGSRKHS